MKVNQEKNGMRVVAKGNRYYISEFSNSITTQIGSKKFMATF